MRRLAWAAAAAIGVPSLAPAVVSAHALTTEGRVPLPLMVYVAGAAVAVAISFAIASMAGPVRAARSEQRLVSVAAPVRVLLRAIGLLGWGWVVAQTIVGGTSEADVSSLFLWTYGWIGVAIVSALFFPIWRWLDPFTTLYDLGAAALRRAGISSASGSRYPRRLGYWPAVAGFSFFVWLELVARVFAGPQLGLVMIGYTIITLAAMGQFGRDEWRERGEVFSVWFRLLNRLAPFGDDTDRTVLRRPFLAGLADASWPIALTCLVALGAGSIIYDGLSQTQFFHSIIGLPSLAMETAVLGAFLAAVVGVVVLVARVIGAAPVGAGLVPVAVGYLIAHYLAALLLDGQRIVVAISDPLQQGQDLFGTAFYVPSLTLPASIAWTMQLGAVVGGHVVGAWAGHGAIEGGADEGRRRSQLTLALLMIAFTGVTLWSLGQALTFVDQPTP